MEKARGYAPRAGWSFFARLLSQAVQADEIVIHLFIQLQNLLVGGFASNLDKKTVALLKAYGKSGKSPAQFLEVMACEGGCISGPSLHTAYDSGRKLFNDALKSREPMHKEEN